MKKHFKTWGRALFIEGVLRLILAITSSYY